MKSIKKVLVLFAGLSFLFLSAQSKTFSERGFVNRIANPDFLLAVEMGLIPGFSSLDKFGSNDIITTSTDPEDIWEGGGLYTYDADGTAPIVSLASDATSDLVNVKISGLDVDGNLVNQTLTLTGQTRVALTTALWRVFRIENEGSVDLAGTVFVYTGTGTYPSVGDPEVRALIDDGNNQTLMCLYTIPKGKVGFLHRGEAGIGATGGPQSTADYAVGSYRSRRFGKVFKVKKDITLSVNGNSIFQDVRTFPGVLPSLTDLRLTIDEVTADLHVWGTFDILLVDEDLFPTSFLTAIGQPGY